jgi:hypothetical protein
MDARATTRAILGRRSTSSSTCAGGRGMGRARSRDSLMSHDPSNSRGTNARRPARSSSSTPLVASRRDRSTLERERRARRESRRAESERGRASRRETRRAIDSIHSEEFENFENRWNITARARRFAPRGRR